MEGMSAWTSEELAAIAGAQELEVAARRRDGSLRKAVPIWVVRAGDDLFVRAAYGPGTGWHRAARAAGAGPDPRRRRGEGRDVRARRR